MSKSVNFIVLHTSVVFNQQLSWFEEHYSDTKEGRNAAFRCAIEKLKEKKAVKTNPRVTEYVLVYKTSITDDILYCQLAKRTQMDTYKFTENTIKQESIDSYPPLDVFISLDQQQIAVELNTKLLSAETIASTVEKLFNCLVKDYNIFVNILKSKKEFWDLVSDQDAIQEISFDMVVPNFFWATGAAGNLVAGAKDNLNADRVELCIKNKKGRLTASLEAIDSYVRYSSVAGSWKLKIKEPGASKYTTIKSTDFCRKKEIDAEILALLQKMDDSLQVDGQIYIGLVNKLSGLFVYEE